MFHFELAVAGTVVGLTKEPSNRRSSSTIHTAIDWPESFELSLPKAHPYPLVHRTDMNRRASSAFRDSLEPEKIICIYYETLKQKI